MTSSAAGTQFFSKTYDETMTLLVAARDYMAYAAPADRPGLTTDQRMRLHCEALRLTARLTHVMAWLLAQKAIHAGELSRMPGAAGNFRLASDDPVCLAETDMTVDGLPLRLRELLESSRRLYIRVARLDELSRRTVS